MGLIFVVCLTALLGFKSFTSFKALFRFVSLGNLSILNISFNRKRQRSVNSGCTAFDLHEQK